MLTAMQSPDRRPNRFVDPLFASVQRVLLLHLLIFLIDWSVGRVQAAVVAVQPNAHRYLTGKESGPTIPMFQQLSVQSKAQQISSSLSGLDDIESYLRSNKDRRGRRRAQDACATEKATLFSCFPDLSCEGCYDGLLQVIENDVASGDITLCGQIENRLCAVNTTCPCGCESQAEVYYQCLMDEQLCETTVDCADMACEEEVIKLADCQSAVGNSCTECVVTDLNLLFGTASTAACLDIESTVCASLDTCGCGECADEVEKYYACAYMNCTSFFRAMFQAPLHYPLQHPLQLPLPRWEWCALFAVIQICPSTLQNLWKSITKTVSVATSRTNMIRHSKFLSSSAIV